MNNLRRFESLMQEQIVDLSCKTDEEICRKVLAIVSEYSEELYDAEYNITNAVNYLFQVVGS